MNLRGLRPALLTRVLLGWSLVATADSAPPDTILFNGKVFTGDVAHPYVQALAISGDRIVATGDSTAIQATSGPQTRQIDLDGRTVIPGINDAHQHLSVSPANTVELPLKNVDPSWAEVRKAILAAARQAPPGSQIVGQIGPAVLHDPHARRAFLDQLVPDHPVILATFTFHGFILNSAALTQLGIREDEPNPVGGSYDRSPDGRLNGVARAYAAMALLRKRAKLTNAEDAVRQLREFLAENARLGVTTVQDMADELPPERALDLLTRVPTSIRVRIMRMPLTTPAGRDLEEGRALPRNPTSLISVSGTKWKLDGNPFDGAFAKTTNPGDPSVWALELTFPEPEMPDRPAEALTREQAVIAYTLTSAYAEFAEKDKGSLETGKLADLAVLSQDIFTVPVKMLPKTESVLTLVGGRIAYDRQMLHKGSMHTSSGADDAPGLRE